MGVNFIVDKAQSMEQAAALTAQVQSLGAEQVRDKKIGPQRETHEAILSDLADGKTAKTDIRVLRSLIQNMATAGIDLSVNRMEKKAGQKAQDEYDLMLSDKPSGKDHFALSVNAQTIRPAQGKNSRQQKEGKEEREFISQELDLATRKQVGEYIESYSKYLVNGSSELKKKIDAMEARLEGKGISPKDLLSIKTSLKNSMRAEIIAQLKDSYLHRIFIKKEGTMEYVVNNWKIDHQLDSAATNYRLGEKDFGNYRGGMENALREMVADARSEAIDYFKEEITAKAVEGGLQDKDVSSDLRTLVSLANKIGFDEEAFLKHWEKQLSDLGMVWINVPPGNSLLQSGADPDRQKKNPYEFSTEEEKDLLCNQLRAIYMQRILKGNFLAVPRTAFKMRKLKNKLIKLGFTIEDFKQVEKEGREAAAQKFQEMLEEVLAERATLYDLTGPALKLIETRVKSILSNLEKLGHPLSEEEVRLMIEKCDVHIHDLAMEELSLVQGLLKSGKHPSAEKKQGQLIKLIRRLREEAKIDAPEINLPRVSDT
jgi:hypothetical protein